jgi:hypothetical protein
MLTRRVLIAWSFSLELFFDSKKILFHFSYLLVQLLLFIVLFVNLFLQAFNSSTTAWLITCFRAGLGFSRRQAGAENTLTDILSIVIHAFERLLYNVMLSIVMVHCWVNLTALHHGELFLSKFSRVDWFSLVSDPIHEFFSHKFVSFSHLYVLIKCSMTGSKRVKGFVQRLFVSVHFGRQKSFVLTFTHSPFPWHYLHNILCITAGSLITHRTGITCI